MREELVEDAIRKGLAYLENVERAKREILVIYTPAKDGEVTITVIPHDQSSNSPSK